MSFSSMSLNKSFRSYDGYSTVTGSVQNDNDDETTFKGDDASSITKTQDLGMNFLSVSSLAKLNSFSMYCEHRQRSVYRVAPKSLLDRPQKRDSTINYPIGVARRCFAPERRFLWIKRPRKRQLWASQYVCEQIFSFEYFLFRCCVYLLRLCCGCLTDHQPRFTHCNLMLYRSQLFLLWICWISPCFVDSPHFQ